MGVSSAAEVEISEHVVRRGGVERIGKHLETLVKALGMKQAEAFPRIALPLQDRTATLRGDMQPKRGGRMRELNRQHLVGSGTIIVEEEQC